MLTCKLHYVKCIPQVILCYYISQGGNKDDLLPLLLNWTQSYTPNSIHGSLVKLLCTFGNKCMSQYSRKALNEWIEFIDVNKFMQTDFTQLLSLYSVVDIVKSYLNN